MERKPGAEKFQQVRAVCESLIPFAAEKALTPIIHEWITEPDRRIIHRVG